MPGWQSHQRPGVQHGNPLTRAAREAPAQKAKAQDGTDAGTLQPERAERSHDVPGRGIASLRCLTPRPPWAPGYS